MIINSTLIIMDRIDLMKAYVAVAESGSLVGAAQRLNITPQLVSKYVRALEDQLNAQLFIRSTRSVRLTETGAAYLGKCRQLLEDFEELAASVRQDHRAPQGKLTIAAPSTYGELFLAEAIADFASTYHYLRWCDRSGQCDSRYSQNTWLSPPRSHCAHR